MPAPHASSSTSAPPSSRSARPGTWLKPAGISRTLKPRPVPLTALMKSGPAWSHHIRSPERSALENRSNISGCSKIANAAPS